MYYDIGEAIVKRAIVYFKKREEKNKAELLPWSPGTRKSCAFWFFSEMLCSFEYGLYKSLIPLLYTIGCWSFNVQGNWMENSVSSWRCSKGWSTPPVKTGWESWGCSAWRRLQGDLTAAFQYLTRAYKEDRERLFAKAFSDRTRDNSFKLHVQNI